MKRVRSGDMPAILPIRKRVVLPHLIGEAFKKFIDAVVRAEVHCDVV